MSPGQSSYREWERERKAQQREEERERKRAEQARKTQERARVQAEADERDRRATAWTADLERRVAGLQTLLRDGLTRDPRVDLARMRRSPQVPPLDLGPLSHAEAPPAWEHFAPPPPGPLSVIFGGRSRHEAEVQAAERRHAHATEQYEQRKSERQRQITRARERHAAHVAEAERAAAEENAELDRIEAGLAVRDRHAVSEYLEMVLRSSPYPEGFPAERHAGYVPESSLLAIEWYLPPFEIVPEDKSFRHIKTRSAVEPVARPLAERRRIYQGLIAQVALRTLHEVFAATPAEAVSTVVFNGRVHAVDPVTGQRIEPHLITLRATREQFEPLVLGEPRFQPIECIRRHFFADVSPHPDELTAVEPVMPYSMADPRAVDPVDVISDIDKRPNLLDLAPKEFEAFIQNLFSKMGFDTQLFQASGDGGVDCVAYDPHPITGGKFIIQAKLYTRTVEPTHVRDLWGTVQHEGATKGIMITTSGYGPDSYSFANGKPLNLIDGTGLLALCHQQGIPARILPRKKK
ncbi:restriction endonuclease [Spirillospora sp. NPDC052269]